VLLEQLAAQVERGVEADFDRFVLRFLQRGQAHCSGNARLVVEFMRGHLVSTMPRLRKLAAEVRDPLLMAAVDQYAQWMRRVGFDEQGGGGPCRMAKMSQWELGSLLGELEELAPRLQELVNAARRAQPRYVYAIWRPGEKPW
jgi:hypothetical protein